jgi:hypothetical protein
VRSIADSVTSEVVQLLESVEIQNHQRKHSSVALLPGDLPVDNGLETPAIVHSRQRIG